MKNTKLQEYANEIKYFNLQDLKLNNISEWPTLIRWASPFLLFFFFVFSFNFFYANDVEKEFSDYEKKEYIQIRKISANSQLMVDNEKMKSQIEQINNHFNEVRLEFPTSIDINRLTEKLLSGHDVENLSINKVSIKQKINNDFYSETPIQILAFGDYHSFGKFITHLANSDEMFSIENVIIEPTENNSSLKFELTLKTYESNNIGIEELSKKPNEKTKKNRDKLRTKS